MLLALSAGESIRAPEPVKSLGEEVVATAAERHDRPRRLVVTAGDVRTRIDGPKLWTLSGIDFRGSVMASEDSDYGTALTIRNVGQLGTAHLLDVPGEPGEVKKEQISAT